MALLDSLPQAALAGIILYISWLVLRPFVTRSPLDNLPGPPPESLLTGKCHPHPTSRTPLNILRQATSSNFLPETVGTSVTKSLASTHVSRSCMVLLAPSGSMFGTRRLSTPCLSRSRIYTRSILRELCSIANVLDVYLQFLSLAEG